MTAHSGTEMGSVTARNPQTVQFVPVSSRSFILYFSKSTAPRIPSTVCNTERNRAVCVMSDNRIVLCFGKSP